MKLTKKTLGSLCLILFLSGCGPARFTEHGSTESASRAQGLGNASQQPPVICDPFDKGNIVSPISGLKGSIHYLEASAPRVSSSSDLISSGKKIDAELFLSQVNVATREFDAGFVTGDGVKITDAKEKLLTEWFALDLKSKLKLADGEAPGDYQLAVLSDDGATLALENDRGQLEAVVENEGQHASQLACASQVVQMDAATRLPMSLRYYQGPRNHISAIVLWRKIPAGAKASALKDIECGKAGNDYFFNVGTSKAAATPKSTYTGMLARGWKPLSAGNFELQSGSNRCSKI